MEPETFLYRRSYHLQIETILLLPFEFGRLLCLGLVRLLWLRRPGQCWMQWWEWSPCLVPDLRGKASSFSPLNPTLAVGSSYMAFTMFRYNLSITRVHSFYHKWVLKVIKCSFASRDDFIFFILHFVGVVYHSYCALNYASMSRINPTWSCVWCFQYIVEFSALIRLRIFASVLIKDTLSL